MKKTLLSIALVAISIVAFAQGNITYELNGGVVNEYGWTNKVSMLEDFYSDFLTQNKLDTASMPASNNTKKPWGADTKSGDIMNATYYHRSLSNMYDSLPDKWGWIQTYILKVATDQNYSKMTDLMNDINFGAVEGSDTMKTSNYYYNGFLRVNTDAFFTNSILYAGAWNESANFLNAGKPAAFLPTLKKGWSGDDTYNGTDESVLPQPYYEGQAFVGWYETADFSTPKVRSTIGKTGNLTLYARYGEYIPTRAEMLEEKTIGATDAKVLATVTYIEGGRVWAQDANADGIVFDFGTTVPAGVAEGKDISVMGTLAQEGGNYVLTSAALYGDNQIEEAEPIVPSPTQVAELVADEAHKLSATLIIFEGVRAFAFDGDGHLTIEDIATGNHVLIANATPSQSAIALGKKVDVIGVVDYSGAAPVVRAYTANVTRSIAALAEPTVYDDVEVDGGRYSLENKWLIAATMGNWNSNRPGEAAGFVRAMAVKDGKLYFQKNSQSGDPSLVVYDAVTGEMEDPVKLNADLFKHEDAYTGTYYANDLKADAAGHLLSANLITSQKQVFQVYILDEKTGDGTLLIEDATLNDVYADQVTIRIDAIGVYGDVTADAVVMGACASSSDVYYWQINGGKWDGVTRHISTKHTGFGTAPQIYPISTSLYYVDGFTDFPVLFNKRGIIVDQFAAKVGEEGSEVLNPLIAGNNGTVQRNAGPNGVCEFELGGEYFLLIAGDNNEGESRGNIATSFVLYKCKDANRAFSEMTKLWEFPQIGMGKNSNAIRVQMPFAVVDEATGTADLYIYGAENGFGRYTFKVNAGSGVEDINATANSIKKVVENGQVYIIKNGVRYSVLGGVVK